MPPRAQDTWLRSKDPAEGDCNPGSLGCRMASDNLPGAGPPLGSSDPGEGEWEIDCSTASKGTRQGVFEGFFQL